jgi:hypothetical protein
MKGMPIEACLFYFRQADFSGLRWAKTAQPAVPLRTRKSAIFFSSLKPEA